MFSDLPTDDKDYSVLLSYNQQMRDIDPQDYTIVTDRIRLQFQYTMQRYAKDCKIVPLTWFMDFWGVDPFHLRDSDNFVMEEVVRCR